MSIAESNLRDILAKYPMTDAEVAAIMGLLDGTEQGHAGMVSPRDLATTHEAQHGTILAEDLDLVRTGQADALTQANAAGSAIGVVNDVTGSRSANAISETLEALQAVEELP